MKKIVFILFLLAFRFNPSFGQVDTCQIDNTIYSYYYNDAVGSAIWYMQSDTSYPYHDSIHVPASLINKVLRSLGMIYKSNSPQRDSVINIFNIHNFSLCYPVKVLRIVLDTSYSWVKQFLINGKVSGNPTFDSLVDGNGFRFSSSFICTLWNQNLWTDSAYNLLAFTKRLKTIPGVMSAAQCPCLGDHSHITFSSMASYEIITYRYGGGDCPSGCTENRFWQFHINPDCSVVFDSSWGDDLSPLDISEPLQNNTIEIYPNPLSSSSTLQLNTSVKNAEVVIYDMLGKEMMRKKLTGDGMEIERGSLESGVYFVRVRSEEREWVEKVVVE